ncbi:Ethyl tert-butyl ether degradation EthD [Rhizobium sp. CF080]|uniref:EthD domain-containing protein n=1 Tax=Rhizobium sp. (strain CF080) TaxID=1144310 RepID=UPI000271CDC6|nr:EthD domain-containing protein [Rhizobium sp. CF080]EUB99236.1 Ethyl tert-butyl ether degradation EthD [Rhizobium sp. CF080]
MIVRFGLLTRRQDLTPEAFADYWRGTHAGIVKKHMPNLHGYLQNRVVDRTQKGIDYKRGSVEVDGLAQLFFPSLADIRGFGDEATLKALKEDEDQFLGGIAILTALQNTVVTPPTSGTFVKRMSFLRKRPDISIEQFQDEWFNMHSILVKRIPGLLGYRQNLVIDRQTDRFNAADTGAEVNVDGVVELWFESTDAIEKGFRSPRGITTMTHAQEFISEISTYMVEVTEIIPEPKA